MEHPYRRVNENSDITHESMFLIQIETSCFIYKTSKNEIEYQMRKILIKRNKHMGVSNHQQQRSQRKQSF